MKIPQPRIDNRRNIQIDTIKAISIVLVLCRHLQPFAFPIQNSSILGSILYTQFFLLGVPVFLFVSLYLFNLKTDNDNTYIKRRSFRIGTLYLFWVFIQFLSAYCIVKFLFEAPFKFTYFMTLHLGGPGLPFVGGSVFYYLFVLFFLTLIMSLFIKAGNQRTITMISMVFIVLFLIYFEICNIYGVTLPYWRMDNFIVYVPAVYLFTHHTDRFVRFKYHYLIGFMIFSVQDFYFMDGMTGNFLPHKFIYDRISIFFGSIALFSFIYSYKIRERWYLSFLSKYSLGIFALHKYWLFALLAVTSIFFREYQMLSITKILYTVSTILLTFISVYWLGFTPLKKFIT